tara:strand:+ start:1547 stop:2239 length:693 start_codon:yes stop_codon:yes gene_type:complete
MRVKTDNIFDRNTTIGILGGMGPYATNFFFKRILDLTPVKSDRDHFHTIIDNNVKIPSRTRAIKYSEKSPVNGIVNSINNLGKAGCRCVMLPCNSAHYFYEAVSKKIQIPWLNMIEIVSNRILDLGYSKPLVLGGFVTTQKKVYSKYLSKSVYLSDMENRMVESIIEEVKINNTLDKHSEKTINSIVKNYDDSIDSILLGCTELPIVINENYFENKISISSIDEYIKYLL